MSFVNAPVSKAAILTLAVTSVVAAFASQQYRFNLPLSPHLTRDHQLWRIPLHHFAFANSSELFVGILILALTSSTLERNLGSIKYASFLVAVAGLSTILELVVLLLPFGYSTIPAGPFAITAAIVYLYSRLVPTTYHWKLAGYTITSRIPLYLLSSQLVFSQPPTTAVISLIGILSSYLVRSDFLSLKSYRLPKIIIRLSSHLAPIFNTTTIPRRTTTAGFGEGVPNGIGVPSAFARSAVTSAVQTNGAAAATRRAAASAQAPGLVSQWTEGITGPATRQPTADQITALAAMFPGQSRTAIVDTLTRSGLDVSRAAETLLTAG